MLILIDSNSIGRASNSSPRLISGDMETQAIFGTLRQVRHLMTTYKSLPVMLWDGHCQWRRDIYPEYKANRVVDPTKKLKPYEKEAQRLKESYYQQRPLILEGLKLLGVTQITPNDDEADDLAGYLAKQQSLKGKKVLLVSRDHDWLQIVDENVDWFNPVDKELVTQKTFEEYTGYREPFQFLSEKCLLGDNSDNIPGVAGIGEKAAPLIINHWGSVSAALTDIKHQSLNAAGWTPPTPELKRYRKKLLEFAADDSEGREIFARNWKLMSLLKKPKLENLTVIRRELDLEAFEEFCHSMVFRSILRDFDEWVKPFKLLRR